MRCLLKDELSSSLIRTLFQDRMDIWEEIEVKVNSENDIPVVKTSNKVGGSENSCCVSRSVGF